MASARFLEILRCNGVDQGASPARMIVPFHRGRGENQVVLETYGMDLKVQAANSAITLQEYDGRELTTQLLRHVQDGLSESHVDRAQRAAYMPSTTWHKPRFFRVLGTSKTGFPGTFVQAVPRSMPGRRAPSPVATLQVAVVDRMVFKVAIRNVRARDQQGNVRFHAKQPCDPTAEVANMNAIWTPQTNIVFELVESTDLVVDHNDRETQEELRKLHGLKPGYSATFVAGSTVHAEKYSGWFAKHKVPGTQMTFFLVHQALSSGDLEYGRSASYPLGTMNRELGVSFISGTRWPRTFAHEAGHFLGQMGHEGADEELMGGEGGGYKITFERAKKFRETAGRTRG